MSAIQVSGLELLDCICLCTSMRYNTYCIEVLVLPPCHLYRMYAHGVSMVVRA